jgi:hypothetical protein
MLVRRSESKRSVHKSMRRWIILELATNKQVWKVEMYWTGVEKDLAYGFRGQTMNPRLSKELVRLVYEPR